MQIALLQKFKIKDKHYESIFFPSDTSWYHTFITGLHPKIIDKISQIATQPFLYYRYVNLEHEVISE